jgi:predicted amidohydrolase
MIIAALQFSPQRADVQGNINRIFTMLEDVEAELVVIPELASTGYFYTDPDELRGLAGTVENDPFVERMCEYAARRWCVVVGGFAERDAEGKLYNAALIAFPDGQRFVYRKAHLFYKEKLIFEPGKEGFFVVEWGGVRIGTMICYDWRFPEATRKLALDGADIIAHPSNLVAAANLWGPVMSTRAFENKVITVTANRSGVETLGEETLVFTGESRIIGMNGATYAITDADSETVITAELDPVATRTKSFNPYNDIFADRRPELYR